MAIQFPAPVNQLNLPAIQGAVQQREWNALKQEQAEQQISQDQYVKGLQAFAGIGKYGQQLLQENPNAYPSFMPKIQRTFQELGVDPSDIPAAGTAPEALMQKFKELEQQGLMGLEALGQQQPERFEDVMGPEGNLLGQRSSTTNKYSPISSGVGGNARIDYMDYLTDDFSTEDELNARRVSAGLDPRAGISADERIATTPGLTEDVAGSQSQIREATKFAEMQGSQRSQQIDKGYTTVQKLDKNIRNLDKAIAAIDSGANTGYIESNFFPSVRESTIQLDQIRNMLGLDVIGSVTFGALSKGELDLALETALPTGLQEAELKEWLVAKKESQTKLRKYYSDQMDFLDNGGSVAGFLRSQDRGDESPPPQLSDFTAQWDAAPSGAVLIAPDGTQRRKP